MESISLGTFHSLFAEFPIVLFTATLIFDLLEYFGYRRSFAIGSWILWLGTFMCIPTIISGWQSTPHSQNHPELLSTHTFLGYILLIYAVLLSLFRLFCYGKNRTDYTILFLALSLILVILTAMTSARGGLLNYG